MGGHIAMDLARWKAGLCRAVIGVEAASRTEGGNLDFLDHPRIGNDVKAELMVGLTSPTAPEARRREIGWGYSQGAPSVFRGDLYFYGEEHDLTGEAERHRHVDAPRVRALGRVRLERDARRVARARRRDSRRGVHVHARARTLPDGRESRTRSARHLLPVLEKILARG